MLYLDEIQIEERNSDSYVMWGVIALIYSIIMALVFELKLSTISNSNDIISDGSSSIIALLYLFNWIIRIIIFIWIIRIAKKLNRPRFLWVFFGLISPAITLIIIGFKDYNLEDENLEKMREAARYEYRKERLKINADEDISANEINEKELALKEKYNNELRKKAGKYIREKENDNNRTQQEEFESKLKIRNYENEYIPSESENLIYEADKCPACGADINEQSTICNDCGLVIK